MCAASRATHDTVPFVTHNVVSTVCAKHALAHASSSARAAVTRMTRSPARTARGAGMTDVGNVIPE